MKNIGIKYQLRITTLIPVLLVALLFAFFYNAQFNKDLKNHTSRLGEAYIRQLIPAAQLALLRDDKRILQGLIDASSVNQELQALAFYNAKGQLLAYRGGKHALKQPFTPPEFTGDYIESKILSPYSINFVAPITLPKFNLYSFAPFKLPTSPIDYQADDILGWLSITVDTQSMLIKRYQMYIITIFITLFGLLCSLSIHYFLSKRLYLPLARLRRSMKQILSNEFETEIKVASQGELGLIEEGCVHLQKNYLNVVKELNQHIETATQDLQKNLELLEEKNVELSLEKKKAEEKSKQKSAFIANMSHEIRTPMNGVLGFTNLLLESNLDPLQRDYVKTIQSSSQDLLTIINDILDYSKMDAGKLHLDCIPLDIRHCIDEVFSLLAPYAHKKGLDLIPATAVNVPKTVLGDPLRLKQVISNLVNNAIKFTDHGYVLVRTSIEAETEKDYTICISVCDTGMGISSKDQSTLFNAFNQVDTTITRRFGGSGLGLIISKKLAEHMNGHISLHSEPHKGSTFSIHIKLEKLAAYEVEKHQSNRFSHVKALCFDDNPLYLEAICNGLGVWGIHCIRIETFNDLSSAFQHYSDCDIAFINVNQGCEQQVAEVIKKQSIPCVMVSKWLVPNYHSYGAAGFLFKPPNIQKLQETIELLLNHPPFSKPENWPAQTEIGDLRLKLQSLQLKLLIAEDNPVNQMLLESFLGDNALVCTVNDGQEAFEKCHTQRFDCILLDLQMPNVNGIRAAKLIRKESILNKSTPILLISANSQDVLNKTIQESGVNICLQKPIDEKVLLTTLIKTITSHQSAAINWPLCIERVSGNKDLALEFLDRFIEELRLNREEFIQLMQHKNLAGLEYCAHKLHGACCFCGVPQLQAHVAQFESLTRQKSSFDAIETAFNQMMQSIDAVLHAYSENSHLSEV